jgi:hypothetical protein
VDALPSGVPWEIRTIKVQGNKKDANDADMTEDVEFHLRDIVECAKEIMGNASFAGSMGFAASKTFETDGNGTEHRTFGEMWTGDWWAEVEVRAQRLTASSLASDY